MVLSTLLITGCWGVREPEELGFILATGLDQGKSNQLLVTFQIAAPQPSGGGGGGSSGPEKGKSTENVSVDSASILGALQLGSSFVSRDLTFLQNRVFIISEEIARAGISKYINPLVRSREIRRNTYLMICRGSARDFIEQNQPIQERNPARQFELLMKGQSFTGLIPVSSINEFYKNVKSPGRDGVIALVGVNPADKDVKQSTEHNDLSGLIAKETAYLPGEIPRKGGNKIDIIGLAVFRGDKLVGYLNGTETRYYQMASGDFKGALITFPDPEQPQNFAVLMRLRQARAPQVKMDLSGDFPLVAVSLILEAEIESIQSGLNYEGGEKQNELERYLEDYLKNEIEKVIRKTQQEYQSDIFGFGERSRKHFWTADSWESYDWPAKYPQAEISVNMHIEIRRTGLMQKTSPIPEEKER